MDPEALDASEVDPKDRIDGPGGDPDDDGPRLAAELAKAQGWDDDDG